MTPEESITAQIAKGTIEVSRLNCDYEDCESLGGSSPDHITVTVTNRLTRVVARVSIAAQVVVPDGHYIGSHRLDVIMWEEGHEPVFFSSLFDDQDAITAAVRSAVREKLDSSICGEFKDLTFRYYINNIGIYADSRNVYLSVQMDIEAE